MKHKLNSILIHLFLFFRNDRRLAVAYHVLRIFGTVPDIDDVIRIMIQINESY